MGFTIDNRPDEANAYAKPNSFLRFGYTVKNLNGTPYNEPYLTDVVVSVFDINSPIAKKTFNFTNGISHQSGTNVIAFALEIKDSELPKGKYRWEINHKRNINSVIENNVMFEGSFEVTTKHRSGCSITELVVNNTGIASITGLREELDERAKIKRLSFSNTLLKNITISGAKFLTERPEIYAYQGDAPVTINKTYLSDEAVDLENTGGFQFNRVIIIY
jgi:hypothetical protein